MTKINFDEVHLSQIPALKLLVNMGYKYISPEDALIERNNKKSNVILENILRRKLKDINSIFYKGSSYLFSEENIQSAVQKIKNIKYDGLVRTNEKIYDLLTLGTSLDQVVEGDSKSFDLNYIDWRNPDRNDFHVSPEYSVERSRSHDTVRPDIVLFVNGIPFAVIECKSPSVDLEEAVSQNIRNQHDDYIPGLFIYSQLVFAVNKNGAKYATTGTGSKFWSVWQDSSPDSGNKEFKNLQILINKDLPDDYCSHLENLFYVDKKEINYDRKVTEQDKTLYSLCRPDRLLELAYKFIVFDAGIKKVARYQQYFVVKSTLERVQTVTSSGSRKGGIIWHTQGSGKSLTMVMLTRNLVFDSRLTNPRIVLVTDRDSLDKQLGNTFSACGLEAKRATSGRNLLSLVSEMKSGIITTLIHKFDKAASIKKFEDTSADIFVLVDESHRTQFGSFSARMRMMFPNACYLGFTGTPLLKKEKNNFAKFGSLIDPHYSITRAVEDGAVLPLLYEGRHVELYQNKKAIDLWFERHTQGLSNAQKADLKKKYARAEMLNKTDQVIYMRTFDISEHFRETWKGSPFKGQLVAPNKASAVKYHKYLDELGFISSEVVISPPDMRVDFEDTDDESKNEVVKFWDKMMKRFGKEEEYNKQIIDQFLHSSDPEILIVVDKLLTGFDAPCNTVLYLCRNLKEHTLLQAIARVNRIHEDKDYGYIVDYSNILGELDTALTMYSAFEGYDEDDIKGTLTSIQEEVNTLPTKYSQLWDIFKKVKNSSDLEPYEELLSDDKLRDDFYENLSKFAKTFAISLSSEKFLFDVDDKTLKNYKDDLKFFQKLKKSAKLRYAETIDYRDYEPRILKLLDTHIQANEVTKLNDPVNIFDESLFSKVKEGQGIYNTDQSTASKADTIANATKKSITENMEKDPAFYQKFSKLIQQAIDDYRAKKISDIEYLESILKIRDDVVNGVHDDIPDSLKGKEDVMAYYGVIKPVLEKQDIDDSIAEECSSSIAIAISEILKKHTKVQFWDDSDAQKRVQNEIDDYLYDKVKGESRMELSIDQMDRIIEETMNIAKKRSI